MIEALLRKCCTMGSKFPDDPATLVIAPEDRSNWISTLSMLSRATPQRLNQIREAAESGQGSWSCISGGFQCVGGYDGPPITDRSTDM